MYNRVKELADAKRMSISEVERQANISRGTIYHWKKGNANHSNLLAVAQVLGTTAEYLTTGKKTNNVALSPELAELSIELLKDKKAQDTFKMFMQLSDSRKEDIFDIVKMFYEKEK